MNRKLGMLVNTKHIGVEEGIYKARKWNLDFIQLYAMNEKCNLNDWSNARLHHLKNTLLAEGVRLSSLAISFGPQAILSKNVIEQYKSITNIGLELGANIITAHIGKIPSDSTCDRYKSMLEVCCELGSMNEEMGCLFGIETGTEKSSVLKRFLEEINSSELGINFDPANIISGTRESPNDFLRAIQKYVSHVHLKDCLKVKSEEGIYYQETAAGQGSVNFEEIFTSLNSSGFNGYYIVERNDYTHQKHGMEQSIKYLSKFL